MRPTTAPRPSTIAIVTMVVPWASDAGTVSAPSSAARPRTTPSAGVAGVVGTFRLASRPDGSRATRSVNVPPTSTPTLLRDDVRVGATPLKAAGVLSRTSSPTMWLRSPGDGPAGDPSVPALDVGRKASPHHQPRGCARWGAPLQL